ncbi:MAG: DNA replication/repair protein RecF [Clostridia bacterium]
MTTVSRVSKLYLRNYRSYPELLFQPDPGVNFLLGSNAAGKTNLLEAIHYLATLRSPRTAKDADMVRWGEKSLYVKGEFLFEGPRHTLEVGYRGGRGRVLRVDGVPVRRVGDFLGYVDAVFFSPDDLRLVKGGPEERRRFLDAEIGQVHSRYRSAVDDYGKILSQRNESLKNIRSRRSSVTETDLLLQPWDEQLVATGSRIVSDRIRHLDRWMAVAREAYSQLTDAEENLGVAYSSDYLDEVIVGEGGDELPDREGIARSFAEHLTQRRSEEIERGFTVVGPHRDDLTFFVAGRDARTYGSQGQQRSVALALKIAEVTWVREETRREPILLLDDVISELDERRAGRLAGLLGNAGQTMITSTHLDERVRSQADPTIWKVSEGEVTLDVRGQA